MHCLLSTVSWLFMISQFFLTSLNWKWKSHCVGVTYWELNFVLCYSCKKNWNTFYLLIFPLCIAFLKPKQVCKYIMAQLWFINWIKQSSYILIKCQDSFVLTIVPCNRIFSVAYLCIIKNYGLCKDLPM